MTATLIIDQDGPVRIITINRPQVRNALDRATAANLARAFHDFDRDPAARVAVLTGADGSFCAGADLREMAVDADYVAWSDPEAGPTGALLSKPVIAAVAGHACAGGLGLALWSDLRIADETAVFGIFSRRWGVPMSDGTTVRLPRLIGLGPAMDMMLTGRPVNAEEALRLGLATRIVPAGEACSAAVALAHQLTAFPQIAMCSDRQSTYAQAGLTLAAALDQERTLAEAAKQQEAASGAQKFAAGAGRHGEFSHPETD